MERSRLSTRAGHAHAARGLLVDPDLDALAAWAAGEPQAERVLQSLLFDEVELVRWRAVEALGSVASLRAPGGLERVRELVRRILWLMNEESGGVLWYGPQAIAAVLANVPVLCPEFAEVLKSFLEEEPFRIGTRWALWRLSSAYPEVARSAASELRASLADPDPAVRGHSMLALRSVGECAPELAGDGAPFTTFDYGRGELRTTTVAEAALGSF